MHLVMYVFYIEYSYIIIYNYIYVRVCIPNLNDVVKDIVEASFKPKQPETLAMLGQPSAGPAGAGVGTC